MGRKKVPSILSPTRNNERQGDGTIGWDRGLVWRHFFTLSLLTADLGIGICLLLERAGMTKFECLSKYILYVTEQGRRAHNSSSSSSIAWADAGSLGWD